jgi:hypothetical protein
LAVEGQVESTPDVLFIDLTLRLHIPLYLKRRLHVPHGDLKVGPLVAALQVDLDLIVRGWRRRILPNDSLIRSLVLDERFDFRLRLLAEHVRKELRAAGKARTGFRSGEKKEEGEQRKNSGHVVSPWSGWFVSVWGEGLIRIVMVGCATGKQTAKRFRQRVT